MALHDRLLRLGVAREQQLNDVLEVLGTTKRSLFPFWERTGTLVTCIGAADLTSAETGGAAEALEDDFSPIELPCGLFAYHFHPTGDHHLAGADNAAYTFGDGSADSAFSVGCWIRPASIASNVMLAKYNATAEEWRFWIDADGKLDLELHDASASATEIAASTSALTAGQWQFVVATYDGTNATPTVNLYVDAALVNDGTTAETGSYVAMEDTATPLTIGCDGVTASPSNEFHGRMALPFITGKELTAAEVQSLYDLMRPMVGVE